MVKRVGLDDISQLRVALVCDWLTEIGGAEQVLLQLTKIFPNAPIYTSQYRKKGAPWFDGADVRTSKILNLFPRKLRKFMAPLRAWYFNHLTIRGYDIVISVNNAECKGVKTPADTLHIAYLQGPPTQYYWGLYDQYLENPGFGKFNWLARWGLKILVGSMRKSDLKSASRPDVLVANSNYVADEIEKYYHRKSELIFPSVKVEEMKKSSKNINKAEIKNIKNKLFKGEDFYIIAGRQVNWKRFDLAIFACGKSVENLLVVGDGPEHERLVDLAKKFPKAKIKFLPKYNGATEIAKYFASAQGFIFPSLEPFGIIPVEAMACGCPVLALNRGGAADIVINQANGLFFDEQSVDSLKAGLNKFNVAQFDRNRVSISAERFAVDIFNKAWVNLIMKYKKD